MEPPGRRQGGQVAALELLLDHDTSILQDPDVVAQALERFRPPPKLGFSDCLV